MLTADPCDDPVSWAYTMASLQSEDPSVGHYRKVTHRTRAVAVPLRMSVVVNALQVAKLTPLHGVYCYWYLTELHSNILYAAYG